MNDLPAHHKAPADHVTKRTGFGLRLVALAAVVALVLVGIGGGLAWRNYDVQRVRAQDRTRMLAQAAAIDTDRYLHSRIELLETIASAADVRTGDPAAIQQYLSGIDNVGLGFDGGMAWVDTNGIIRAVRGLPSPAGDVSLTDRDYFRSAIATGETAVGQAVIGRLDPFPIVPIGAPTRNLDGEINGVLIGSIRLDTVSDQSKVDLFGTVSVVILDRSDQVIIDRDPVTELRSVATHPDVEFMRASQGGVLVDVPNLNESGNFYTGFAQAPFGDWLVLVEQDAGKATASARRQFEVELGLLLTAGLGGIGGVGLFARRLDRSAEKERLARLEAERAQVRFRRLIESGVLAAAVTSPDGDILEVNDAFKQMIGNEADPGDGRTLSWSDLISPESRRNYEHLVSHLRRDGKVAPHDLLLRVPGGTLPVVAGGIALESSGETTIFLIDISDQKKAEQALQESEERLRNAIAAAQLVPWEFEPSTGMVTWEERGAGEPTTVRLQFPDFVELIHPDDRPRIERMFHEAAKGDGSVLVDFQLWVDGAYEGRSVRGHAVRDAQGKIVLFRGVSAEVTERLALERARQAFVDGVAHDLKNPLSAIKAQSELVSRRLTKKQAVDPDWLDQRVSAIEASAVQAARQLDELADVAHLEAGTHLELRRGPVDLVEVARSAVEASSRLADHREIRLESGPDRLVGMWDALRLTRAVGNLVGNAVKYSPDGSIVTVSLRRDGDLARLEVADQGIGIPAEDQLGIFAFRRRAANVGGVQGSGVGLASAAQIVELHGGSIDVASVEGSGSVFTILLPLRLSPKSETLRLATAANGD